MPRSPISIFALHCSILMLGCGNGGGETCSVDADCASKFCRADHTCSPTDLDAGVANDGSGSDGATGVCTPNHDGSIDGSELPLAAGQSAKFRIATNATWSTAGTANGDGSRTWDLSGQLSSDADSTVALASPTGAWWAADFTAATYATPLSSSSTLLGVFEVNASGVTLLGVVSPTGGGTKTELAYDPPAKILAVPFKAGDTWTSTSTVTGYADGVITGYSEEYDSSVDQVGTMTTPYGAFPVLRVATTLERTEGVATLLTNKTFAWVAECFGPVATVTSQSFESGTEFSNDAEVERLAP